MVLGPPPIFVHEFSATIYKKKKTLFYEIKKDSDGDLISELSFIEYKSGTKKYYKDGKLHKEDGPAVEFSNGSKKWYRDGLLHNDHGPAVEWVGIGKEWWINGELHRDNNMPAIEDDDGGKSWFIHNKLHRLDGPA